MARKEIKGMASLKWKKLIMKEKVQRADGEHILHRIYITQYNTETNEYLISPFSDFLNEFTLNKATSANMAADIVARFLNYLYFTADKDIYSITIQDTVDFIETRNIQQDTQRSYTSYLTKFYHFVAERLPLQYISLDNFTFDKDRKGHMVMRNLFTDHVTPDIAFGIYLQCFGGLRKSEVISLEYKNIATAVMGGRKTMQITLEDKDLREDIPTAFISKCKRNRTQTIIPVFDDMLCMLYEKHKERYKKNGCSAVFVNSNGKAMTDATYYKRFRKLKEAFIKRLEEAYAEGYSATSLQKIQTISWRLQHGGETEVCRQL